MEIIITYRELCDRDLIVDFVDMRELDGHRMAATCNDDDSFTLDEDEASKLGLIS